MHKIISYFIASAWFFNGLIYKVLNIVPRHQEIVGRILGNEYARTFTLAIGISEICMAVWIMTGFKSRTNAILQILIVAAMNVLEFVLVPDLLLWGKFNSLFAFLFILLIYFNEFVLNKSRTSHK